ncbi:MAG: hypothetical protein QNJ91_06405 [Gammaproteobacteria bacterium]|nr:hypothetical protein [Gammaproteobacteria bacterium]
MRPAALSCLLLLAAIGAVAGPLRAADADCPAIAIDDDAGVAADTRRLVCQGAGAALTFLAGHGVQPQRRIRVALRPTLRSGDTHLIGRYDRRSDRIELLTFDAAAELSVTDALFGEAMDAALYRSVVAHEVAHAIVEQNRSPAQRSRVPHEYVAYVVQLSVLPATTRARILARDDAPAYASVDEMSWIYYLLDPGSFGVKAYRHFVGLADPRRFLDELLSGAIRAESDPMDRW